VPLAGLKEDDREPSYRRHLRHEVLSFVVPSGRPRMRENRVRSLAEVGGSWRSEPVFEFDPGSRSWGCALSL